MVEKTVSSQTGEPRNTDIPFAADTEIIVSVGWCGGMGEAVLAPPDFIGIQFFQDLPVFVTDTRIRDYVQNRKLTCDPAPSYPQRIRIQDRIRFVKKTERNGSIRGAPLQTAGLSFHFWY